MADDPDATIQPNSNGFRIAAIIAILIIVLCVVVSVVVFRSGLQKAQAGKPLGQDNVSDGLHAEATVTSVDPIKGEMNIRLALVPVGSFDDSGLLARPVTLYFSSPDGTKQIDMKTGKPLAPVDLTLPLLGDTVSSYPWDSYNADMDLLFLTTDGSKVATSTSSSGSTSGGGGGTPTTTAGGGAGSSTTSAPGLPATPSTPVAPAPENGPTTSEGAAVKAPPIGESALPAQTTDSTPSGGGGTSGGDKPAPRPDTVVPVELTVFTNIPAYTVVELQDSTPNNDGVIEAVFNVTRGSTAIVYSLFVAGLMWVLAIGVLMICLSVVFRRRKLELAVISMMGIVLFAMPAALRSFQPGVPPPGVLSDFYSFFWCVAIVAVSLVTVLITFLTRGPD